MTADLVRPSTPSTRRLLAGRGGTSLAEHVRSHGPLPTHSAAVLLSAVEQAGLTGRGGAAFPTYRKLTAVAAGSRPVVLANGSEGEPASGKDRSLLTVAPHLVLDGIQLAARAVGAHRAYLYVARDEVVQRAVAEALAQRTKEHGGVKVEVVTAPDRFIAGQETAAVSKVNGGLAIPRFAQPPVYEKGVRGRPTLVQNVETLAQLALIARHGPAWFRSVGTDLEPGTMLVTVSGAVARPQVLEVALGTEIADVIELAGGASTAVGAVLVGGYHGAWLPPTALRRSLANADLRADGASVGAGVIAVLPDNRCGVIETARVAAYLAGESARQCGPCLNGLPAIAGALAELAGPRPRRGARADVERWAGLMPRRGACAHPDGTVRFVNSALRVFAAELTAHERGHCTGSSTRAVLPTPQTADRGWK